MRRFGLALVLVAGVLALADATPALADTAEDQAAAYAVQNREYRLGHELHAAFGVLPLNAFDKGITVAAGYTYHFSPLVAWEIGQFVYAFDVDTGLKQQLLENFSVQPTSIPSLRWMASSNILIKPFYGKLAALNRSVIHLELFFAIGGSVGYYQSVDQYRFGPDIGAGLRMYMGTHVSLRLDVRDTEFFVNAGGVKANNELYIALAVALSFGGRQ